jgi:hypothetical protein
MNEKQRLIRNIATLRDSINRDWANLFPIHHSAMRSAPRLGLTSNSPSKTLRSGPNGWTNYRQVQIRTPPKSANACFMP